MYTEGVHLGRQEKEERGFHLLRFAPGGCSQGKTSPGNPGGADSTKIRRAKKHECKPESPVALLSSSTPVSKALTSDSSKKLPGSSAHSELTLLVSLRSGTPGSLSSVLSSSFWVKINQAKSLRAWFQMGSVKQSGFTKGTARSELALTPLAFKFCFKEAFAALSGPRGALPASRPPLSEVIS